MPAVVAWGPTSKCLPDPMRTTNLGVTIEGCALVGTLRRDKGAKQSAKQVSS